MTRSTSPHQDPGPAVPVTTRRRWPVGRRAALPALAVGLALALAACGGSPQGSSNVSSAPTGAPVQGDTLTFAEQQPPATLDPGSLSRDYTDFTQLAYDPLMYLASDGTVQPRLAESWSYIGTGNKQLDVKLRSGATFSDGDPVNAAAVVASLQNAQGGKSPQATFLKGMTFTAADDATVSIKMTTPNPILPTLLTQKYTIGQIISPKGLADEKSLSISGESHGAGPYTFAASDSVAGDHYTYNANPTYYDKSQQHYKKIVIRIINDKQAALNAAKTGQVALFKGDGTLAAQAQTAGLQVVANPGIMTGLFLIDRDGKTTKAMGDVRVRQAINYAIDREAVTKALLGTYGVPAYQTVTEGSDGWSEKDASYYAYNPDKAKQLLTEAGYPNGFDLKVMGAVFAGFDQMADAVKGQLAKVGIRVTVDVKTDLGSFVQGGTDGTYSAWSGGYDANPMYQQGLDLWLPGSSSFNGFKTSSPELNALWEKAAGAAPDERAQLDVQMQEYLVENAWFAPVSWSPVMYFASKDLGGVATSAGAPFASPLSWYATK